MPTDPRFVTPDARRTSNRLLDVLQRERIAAATDPSGFGPSEIHAKLALIERAKGALMLHYGITSHQAFAVLVGWARISHTSLPTIAHTLLRGICEGDPQTAVRQRALMGWLEAQLRDREPVHALLGPAPAPSAPAHETPRSA